MYEHRFMENIKKSYKSAGKCDDQQQYKAIIVSSMVSTTEVFNDNSPMSPSQYMNVKNPIAINSLHQFLDTLEVKPKTDVRMFCAAKSKRKAIIEDSILCSSVPNRRGHSKNQPTGQKISLQIDFTTYSGCAVPNRKLLYKILYCRSSRTTVSSKIFIEGIGHRTT